MNVPELSIRRPVLVTMFLAALLLAGVIGYRSLALNYNPDIDIPVITIQTVYPGAGPREVATQVSRVIEDEVSTVSGINALTSYSLENASVIIIEFGLQKDPDIASQEVKDKIEVVLNDLPSDAQSPVTQKFDITATPVITLMLSGDIPDVELGLLARTTVRDSLSQVPGVGNVELEGLREREIHVEFDNRAVFENRISLPQVAQILSAANMDMPAGNISDGRSDLPVRLAGRFGSVEAIRNLEIPTAAGLRPLESIATVRDTGEQVRVRTTLFDVAAGARSENTVLLSVLKAPDGNTVDIALGIRDQLQELAPMLPEGVDLRIINDQSIEIDETIADTLMNIILGIALTSLVLVLFLHDLRAIVIVGLAMPMSIVAAFALMPFFGMSLNTLSLMGIATAVGVLVMNSVVVLENIFRYKLEGADSQTAAAQGTSEVATAVVASTATNIAVFLPMALMGGFAGLFLREFALAISFATLFSMVVSFTLTPMLAAKLLPDSSDKKYPIGERLESAFKSMEHGYKLLLTKILHSRVRSTVLVVGTLVLFVFSIRLMADIPFDFIPAADSGRIEVEVELSQGSDLEVTTELVRRIEERMAEFDEISMMSTTLGASSGIDTGTNLAQIEATLVDRDQRRPNTIIAPDIAEALGDIPGARIAVRAVTNDGGGPGGADVEVYLVGADSVALTESAIQAVERMAEIPGLVNLDVSTRLGQPEIVLRPDRVVLRDLNLSVAELANSMRAAVDGINAGTFQEDSESYDIRVLLSGSEVGNADDIAGILIPTEAGLFPVGQLADVDIADSVNRVTREDKQEAVAITAGLAPGYVLGQVTAPIEEVLGALDLPAGAGFQWSRNAEMLEETVNDFMFVFVIAVLVTYMLLGAILERFGQPILILSTVPLSLIGVVWFMLWSGQSMNIVAMLAIVMLVGMVVNNAILILDYTNQLRGRGMGVRKALIEAAPTKLKPILMANTATILGMLPLALGIGGAGVELRQPMGVVAIGGLITATFLSLFVIPALENAIVSRKSDREAAAA